MDMEMSYLDVPSLLGGWIGSTHPPQVDREAGDEPPGGPRSERQRPKPGAEPGLASTSSQGLARSTKVWPKICGPNKQNDRSMSKWPQHDFRDELPIFNL